MVRVIGLCFVSVCGCLLACLVACSVVSVSSCFGVLWLLGCLFIARLFVCMFVCVRAFMCAVVVSLFACLLARWFAYLVLMLCAFVSLVV